MPTRRPKRLGRSPRPSSPCTRRGHAPRVLAGLSSAQPDAWRSRCRTRRPPACRAERCCSAVSRPPIPRARRSSSSGLPPGSRGRTASDRPARHGGRAHRRCGLPVRRRHRREHPERRGAARRALRALTRRWSAHLPSPSSDQSAAAIGGTAYVVGGFTGSRWLDTIVAWRPGAARRGSSLICRSPLRYAAVAAVGGRLVIAGGSLRAGAASAAVFAYIAGDARASCASGGCRRRRRTPRRQRSAGVAYVVGGRGAGSRDADGPHRRDRRTHEGGSGRPVRSPSPRSDLAAVAFGDRDPARRRPRLARARKPA